MNEIKVFEYEASEVRSFQEDGELFFVAKDVCEALGYEWDRNLIIKVPPEWKEVKRIHTPGGEQNVTCLHEEGVYFFINRSDKPKAVPFQKWIAGEVIPAIRETGSYALPKTDDQLIVVGYEAAIRKIRLLEKKVETDAPKVESAEALTRCDKNMCIRDAAKHFGLHPRTQVFAFLREKGFLTTRDLPTQDAIDAGLLSVRQNKINDTDFKPQAVVETAQLEKWRTWLVPRIVEWSNEDISA